VQLTRQLLFLEHRKKADAMRERKADNRHKIQLGGIVIKAGAGGVDAYALLGLLVEHASRLQEPDEQRRLRDIGRAFASREDTTGIETDA
jgi:Conjugal transfer protein TraD